MPRANRYLCPGRCYHLTHRCADRAFLLGFARDRAAYRERLRVVSREERVPLLNYGITSNHVHLLVQVEDPARVSRMMQRVAGGHGLAYNRRKGRSGPFWEDRYHATAIDGDLHLWRCLRYIDLNMVRAGKVAHPEAWRWTGFHELVGRRKRYRLLDPGRLLQCLGPAWDAASLAADYRSWVEQGLDEEDVSRDPVWTESVAVGSEAFVETTVKETEARTRWIYEEQQPGIWSVREGEADYA